MGHRSSLRIALMARTDPRPNYGAKRRVHGDGYIDIYSPGHPLARADGYVHEHRLVVWDAGLLTEPSLQVHHRNGDKQDNRIENLQVLTAAEHSRLHWDERRPTHCPQGHEFTEDNTAYGGATGWRYCKQCNRDRAREHKRLARERRQELAA